jgi:glycosyltransferase involved in cell wall biosynthesis
MHITVVVPLFNEEKVIEHFYRRMKATIEKVRSHSFTLLFVNDGSTDGTLQQLKRLALSDHSVRIVDFSRNFGHQAAILAGIQRAEGEAAVIIDGDLQDPPEVIPRLIQKWEQGFEVVYGKRIRREGESAFKRLSAFLFYRLMRVLSDTDVPKDVGDFRLIDRKVIDVLKDHSERNIFIRGLIAWIGFRQTFVEYERDRRYAGDTKYPLIRMLNFALDGITSFSIKPLRLSLMTGLVCIFIGVALIIYTLVMKYVYPETVISGWTSLFIAVIFFGGVQLFTMGIVGEYLGKVYKETKHRPLYIVRDAYGFGGDEEKKASE